MLAAILVCMAARQIPAGGYKGDCQIFLLKDCPIANQYMPEVARLYKQYSAKGIQFEIVFEDSDITTAAMDKFRREFSFKGPMLMDKEHWLAKQCGVTISPTAVVRHQQTIYYVGRIDDTYATIAKRNLHPKHHELRDGLDAFLAGRRVKVQKTQAVGCRLY